MELAIFTLFELDDRGDVQQVRDIIRMLLEAWPSDRDVCNAAAWLLATSQHEAVRDGARAFELARIACAASAAGGPELGTLAAALAETGRFDEAREFQRRAMSMYPSEWLAAGEARLELYKQSRPYRRDPTRGDGW